MNLRIGYRPNANSQRISLAAQFVPVRGFVSQDVQLASAPGDDHGSDSAADGSGEVRQPRMHQLVRQKGPIKDAIFEIEFLDPGVEAFSFTFG